MWSLELAAEQGVPAAVMELPQPSSNSRANMHAHQLQRSPCISSPPATHAADVLSRKLARYWKRFLRSGKTTLALARTYDSLGISEITVKSTPFDDLVTSLLSPTVLQAAEALLDRLETRLVISSHSAASSSSPLESIDHLLKHINPPPRKTTAPRNTKHRTARLAAAKRPATAASSRTATTTSSSPRYSPRVVLSAYMIVAHPSTVLSGQDVGEKELKESAAIFVKELEQLVKAILEGPAPAGGQFRAQLECFDKAWCAFLYGFVAWKVKDARVFEADLVGAACKFEVSMMLACKVGGDGAAPSESELTHDMRAIRDQVSTDQALLRDKVRLLTGDAGVERMDAAISDARSEFLEAMMKNGGPAATPVVANVSTPLSVDSSPSPSSAGSSSLAKEVTEKELMVNDILHQGVGDDLFGDKTAEKDLEKRVREQKVNKFWDSVVENLTGDKPDYSMLVTLVAEVKGFLHELSPKKLKEEIAEKIDIEILSQVLGSGSQEHSAQYLGQILQYSLDMVRKLSAAAVEDEMKKSHENLLRELAASSEVGGNNGASSSFGIAVSKGLRFVVEEVRELRAQVTEAHIQIILRGSAGVECLQEAFADRYGPPANASASLPLTLQLVSASKSVVEQEWREHSEALAALPSAGRAHDGVVPVLRAGQGALVRQPSSSPSAAPGDSGQPECNGEMVDKIVRIGLLQLISGIEELQLQSTPESFQINLLRLKAVQIQFQLVIMVAISMLIMRQVLMSESPKPTPAKVESAISELFEALMKKLDGSPDAGTEDVVEAMVQASTAVGSSTQEKIQARRQVMDRVFTKSFQPDDTVFKMVSRAVHCAFRGVVLGGDSDKGRKLAEAALRRVGAARLADRVVKAAEVVIKVATVSEKVHGPWYNALV